MTMIMCILYFFAHLHHCLVVIFWGWAWGWGAECRLGVLLGAAGPIGSHGRGLVVSRCPRCRGSVEGEWQPPRKLGSRTAWGSAIPDSHSTAGEINPGVDKIIDYYGHHFLNPGSCRGTPFSGEGQRPLLPFSGEGQRPPLPFLHKVGHWLEFLVWPAKPAISKYERHGLVYYSPPSSPSPSHLVVWV